MTKSVYLIMRGKHVLDVCESLSIADKQIEMYEKHKIEKKNYLYVAKRQMITRKDWKSD